MSKITYTNKSFINENPDVAAQNKVSASDMNEIKNVVNNNDDTLINTNVTLSNVVSTINTISTYSTAEQTIGTWIDNKPIYRKVINFTNTSTDWVTIDTISNLNEIVRMNGYVYDGGNNKTLIPSYGTDSVSLYVSSDGAIRKKTTSYYQNKSGVLIIEYTKTTD